MKMSEIRNWQNAVTNEVEIPIFSMYEDAVILNNKPHPSLVIKMLSEPTAEQLAALTSGLITIGGKEYRGYTNVSECTIILYRATDEELLTDQFEKQIQEFAPYLPEEKAVAYKKYYKKWDDEGGLELSYGDYFTRGNNLYKSIDERTHITKKGIPEDTATSYVQVNDPNQTEHPYWIPGVYAYGYKCWHNNEIWTSTIDSNTFEPEKSEYWVKEVPVEIPPVVEEPPAIDPNDKNSNGTIRWDEWQEPKVMTDYYNTGDGITDNGVQKVSTKDFNADPPNVTTSWEYAK
jgi:hypothetical protein